MMTTESIHDGRRAEFEIDELLWELELLDGDWVDEEFTAIMIASGFGRHIRAGLDPRSAGAAVSEISGARRPRREGDQRHLSARVRSPPAGR